MRRLTLLVPLAVLVAVLLARRRLRTTTGPLQPAPERPAIAALPSGPRFLSAPWTLTAEPPADRAELAIRYSGGEHLELDRIDVQETPTQVFLTVLLRWLPPAGGGFA